MLDKAVTRRIAIAAFIWMASVALSRVMGFLREFIIARLMGANIWTDIYFAAFTIPDFLNYLLAGGAISITFIPVFSAYVSRGEEEEGRRALSIALSVMSVFLCVFIAVGEVFTGPLCRLVAPGFTEDQQQILVYYTRILLPAQFFFYAGGLLSAVQIAKDRHLLPALAPLVYNGGIIALGLCLGPYIGMAGFCYGALAGSFIGNFLIQVIGARRAGFRYGFLLEVRHEGFLKFIKLAVPIMIGQSIVITDEWMTKWFASSLAAASISWLNYARTLMRVPPAVFGQAAGIASFPSLSRMHVEGRREDFHAAFEGSLRVVLVLSALSSVIMFVFAPEIIVLVYRGRAFSAADVEATASALRMFSIGIFAWSAHAIVSRGFYAMADTLTPVITGTAVTILSIPLYKALCAGLGHAGLALSTSISIIAYSAILYGLLRVRLRKHTSAPGVEAMWRFMLKLAGATAVSGFFGYAIFINYGFAGNATAAEALLRLAAGSAICLAVFCGVAYLCNLRELTSSIEIVMRKIGLKKA